MGQYIDKLRKIEGIVNQLQQKYPRMRFGYEEDKEGYFYLTINKKLTKICFWPAIFNPGVQPIAVQELIKYITSTVDSNYIK